MTITPNTIRPKTPKREILLNLIISLNFTTFSYRIEHIFYTLFLFYIDKRIS